MDDTLGERMNDANALAGFDEAAYLAANPDVHEAVLAGSISSALEHYRHWGRFENRPDAFGVGVAVPAELTRRLSTRQLDVPPGFAYPGLNLTVSNADTMLGGNDSHYLSVGQSALDVIERALGGVEPRNILDLPCGFGRVTRALRARFPGAAITVSDLDRPGVDFSALEFDARSAYSVRDFQELDLGEVYDLIWVGSLMTHLPALQTKRLISALGRHLSPSGVAIITLQGPSVIPLLRKTGYGLPPGGGQAVIEEYQRTGFGYGDYGGGADLYGVSLTNDHYGISLTDETWMRASLEELGLQLHAYEVQAWDNHHDVAVAVAASPPERGGQ